MNNWDKRWMSMCELLASWSKDRSRNTSAIIVNDRHALVSIGWNGFPRGINDDIDKRHERPAKYMWTEHAERNAIYNASSIGVSTRGCIMYMPWYPCADCARAIIQSGIIEVRCGEPDWSDPKWKDDFAVVSEMLGESDVNIVFMEGQKAPESR